MSQPIENKSNFWGDVLGSVPLVGPIIGGIIQRGQDRRAIDRQNEYNKPINQLARLREAGLPYAAMTNAISGNQSQTQQSTSPGVSEGISSYVHTTMQRKQMELLQTEIDKVKQDTQTGEATENKTWAEALRIKSASDEEMDRIYNFSTKIEQGQSYSNQVLNARREVEMRILDKQLKENSKELSDLDLRIQRDLTNDGTLTEITRTQLQAMITSLAIGKQALNKGRVMDSLIEHIKKDGIKLHEALLMAFMTNQLGSGSVHFPDYNPRNTNINVTGEQYHEHIRRD